MAALQSLSPKILGTPRALRRCSLTVVRFSTIGGELHLRCAKPCDECAKVLAALGLRRVWYSTVGGTVVGERPDELAMGAAPSTAKRRYHPEGGDSPPRSPLSPRTLQAGAKLSSSARADRKPPANLSSSTSSQPSHPQPPSTRPHRRKRGRRSRT
mmetsp:Transcript_95116/g.217804  ORF Transcript_95116/g.217804 Transcript_95116/m.217804 type:complete len:156 (-) Transcript_95116:7-474(-)